MIPKCWNILRKLKTKDTIFPKRLLPLFFPLYLYQFKIRALHGFKYSHKTYKFFFLLFKLNSASSIRSPSYWAVGFVWLGRWKSRMIENIERMEKWEDWKDLVFPRVCLVGKMEKWRDEKLICLDEKKNERMKNIVGINLLLYPYYLKYFIFIFNYITHKYINIFISKSI